MLISTDEFWDANLVVWVIAESVKKLGIQAKQLW